uniref:Type VI secretion system spike protein VgrG3-like C-terminal domain-containing protein n=1 Tax=Nitratidesulfovibrio vulgaris (strain DSM 19637 / Miyazaki F) TaxID=883 RepID=B8DMQ4_NITV9
MAYGKNISMDALQTLVEGRSAEGTRRAGAAPRAGQRGAADPRFAALLAKGAGAGASPLGGVLAGGLGGGAASSPQLAALPGLTAAGGQTENALAADDRASRAAMDIVNSRALATLAKVMEGGTGGLDSLRGAMTSRNLMALSGNLDMATSGMGGMGGMGGGEPTVAVAGGPGRGGAQGGAGKAARRDRSGPDGAGKAGRRDAAGATAGDLGGLSAQFESGEDGIAAIGYDRHGGTSYGKYQISSRAGTMDRFLDFARQAAPDIASRLEAAGPANTGGKTGEMPRVWREIADEQPDRFEALQERFIHESHYAPALQAVSRAAGLNKGTLSPALREVLWSTAVQHGPAGATRIFARALDNMAEHQSAAQESGQGDATVQAGTARAGRNFEKQLIREVYAVRSGQFGSSSERVQAAVQNRLDREMKLALAMTDGKNRA